VSSGKGGVGKTSFTVNMALALARKQQRVLVIDADLGLANVDVLFGLHVERTIRDLLEDGSDPMESVLYLEPNLGVLPASSGVPEMVNLDPDDQLRMEGILQDISRHFDYVFLDTAAGIGPSVLWFNHFADHNFIVLSPDPTSITDAYALIKVLSRDYQREDFFLILNLVTNEGEGRRTYDNVARVVKQFLKLSPQYFGAIPVDEAVVKANRERIPFLKLSPQSKAAQAIVRMADQVLKLQKACSPT